jgi:peptide/nickel transport system ATP-binding protein
MLDISNLSVRIATPQGSVAVVEDASLSLAPGETLGIVGESGSGKSMLALATVGLLPQGASATGRVLFDGQDLLALSEAAMCRVRGARIGMIFQEPMTALNPAMTVGDQIAEGIVWHRGDVTGRRAARAEALRLMDRVRIPDAKRRFGAYPHELSGGQRQRIAIAVALALGPALLIADEPTTALDVTVQAGILDLLDELVRETGMALMIISHDLGVISDMADRTLVMYAGTRVEEGETADILRRPAHPYTRGLLAAMPRRRRGHAAATGGGAEGRRLETIPGAVPAPGRLPPGCRFSARCAFAVDACRAAEPGWRTPFDPEHGVRCIRAEEFTA